MLNPVSLSQCSFSIETKSSLRQKYWFLKAGCTATLLHNPVIVQLCDCTALIFINLADLLLPYRYWQKGGLGAAGSATACSSVTFT